MLIVWPPGHYRSSRESVQRGQSHRYTWKPKSFLENNNKNAPKLIHDNNCKISLSAGPVQEAARTKGVQGSDAGVQYSSRVHVGGVKGLRECSEV